MSSSSGTDPSLARTLQAGHRVQGRVKSLMNCFDIGSIPAGERPEGKRWSEVECTGDGPKVLDEVRAEFLKEFNRSHKITDIINEQVTTSIKPAEREYSFTRPMQLLAFQSGWSYLGEHCIVLIPVTMSDTIEATIEQRSNTLRTALTFTPGTEIMISGDCQIWIPDNCKVVCGLLGIRIQEKEKGKAKDKR